MLARRPALRASPALALVALLVPAVAACSGGGGAAGDGTPAAGGSSAAAEPSPPAVGAGLVELVVDGARLGRPADWTASTAPLTLDQVAVFQRTGPDGEFDAQLDVLVNTVPAGSQADEIDAVTQGKRSIRVLELRSVDRRRLDVPGADSGLLNESTYTTPAGKRLRSLDLTAIADDGRYVLVRLSTAAEVFDEALARRVMESVVLEQMEGA